MQQQAAPNIVRLPDDPSLSADATRKRQSKSGRWSRSGSRVTRVGNTQRSQSEAMRLGDPDVDEVDALAHFAEHELERRSITHPTPAQRLAMFEEIFARLRRAADE